MPETSERMGQLSASPESVFNNIIADAIQGKKISKWVIQLLLFSGIAIIVNQAIMELHIEITFILFIVFFGITFYLRDWLEALINNTISDALSKNNFTEIFSYIEDVLGNKKSIIDETLKLTSNIGRIAILGLSNVLFIVFLFLLIDKIFANILGLNYFTQLGYLGGFSIIGTSLILYMYFEVKPFTEKDNETKEKSQDIVPLFYRKYLYENIVIKKRYLALFSSLVSLFFLIPHINIRKRSSWLGFYLCTPQLSDYIRDLARKKNNIITHSLSNIEDFFTCDKIKGLEDLVNVQNILPLEFLKRIKGQVAKDHPAPMAGLTIKFTNNEDEKTPEKKAIVPYLSMYLIPWKGCNVKRQLSAVDDKKDNATEYTILTTYENCRIFSIFLIGDSEEVENLKFQFYIRAPEAKPENFFIVQLDGKISIPKPSGT